MAYKIGCIINLISYLFAIELADEDLGDEDVLALESISEISKISEEGGEGEANLQITLIITLKDAMLSLSRVFKIIEVRKNYWYLEKLQSNLNQKIECLYIEKEGE